MKSIKVNIFGKYYPLKVDESDEENMYRIAKFVDERFKKYKEQLAKQPESTIMSLAALSIAAELFEVRAKSTGAEKAEEVTLTGVNNSLEKLLASIQDTKS